MNTVSQNEGISNDLYHEQETASQDSAEDVRSTVDRKAAAEDILTGEPLSSTQQEATRLTELKLTVFPILKGQKLPQSSETYIDSKTGEIRYHVFPWKRIGLTLHSIHPRYVPKVFSGSCNICLMMGTAPWHPFAIDCENRDTLRQYINELKKRKIPVWTTLSSRGGHIILFSLDGPVKNVPLAGKAKEQGSGRMVDAEIKGCNGYIVIPPSLHPEGKFYQWLERSEQLPIVRLEQIDFLRDANGQQIKLTPARKKRHTVTIGVEEYLKNGAPEGIRNHQFLVALIDLLANNRSIEPAIIRARLDGLDEREIRDTTNSARKNVQSGRYKAPQGQGSRRNKNAVWQRATEFAADREWHGRVGATDRAVFLALVERSRLDALDTQSFRATVREICEKARCSKPTAIKALNRLQALGDTSHPQPLIRKVGKNEFRATEWEFTDIVLSFKSRQENHALSLPIGSFGTNCTDIGKVSTGFFPTDAAERGAIGTNGWICYRTLLYQTQPISSKELSELSGVSLSSIQYALRSDGVLRQHGLVECLGKKWIAHKVDFEDLQAIAAKQGVLGKGEKRVQQHVEERQVGVAKQIIEWREKYDPGYPQFNRNTRRKKSK